MATTLTVANPAMVEPHDVVMATTNEHAVLNGQSWKKGQFLFLDANARLKACASDADASTGGIKFLALNNQDDPGANDTDYPEVGIITDEMVFEINELDGTVATANIGVAYGIDVTSNVVTIDVGDTSNPALQIVSLGFNRNPVLYKSDDIKAKVYAKVIPAVVNAANA